MSKHRKLVAALFGLALSLSAIASPAVPPSKKAAVKHHPKMIPARHNAGRPLHS